MVVRRAMRVVAPSALVGRALAGAGAVAAGRVVDGVGGVVVRVAGRHARAASPGVCVAAGVGERRGRHVVAALLYGRGG